MWKARRASQDYFSFLTIQFECECTDLQHLDCVIAAPNTRYSVFLNYFFVSQSFGFWANISEKCATHLGKFAVTVISILNSHNKVTYFELIWYNLVLTSCDKIRACC